MRKILLYLSLSILFAAFSINVFGQKATESTSEAVQLMVKGDIPGAIAVLDKAIARKKDLFEAYRLRAFLRQRTNDLTGAVDDLTKALEINPQAADLYEERAFTRMLLRQDYALILKDLDTAISFGRKVEKIYSLRAGIKRQMGDNAGAISDYQTVIGLRPDYAHAHIGLASIYLMSGDEEKAVSILENFIYTYENPDKMPKVKGVVVDSNTTVLQPSPNMNPNTTILLPSSTEVRRTETIVSSNVKPMSADESIDKLEQAKNTALVYSNLAVIYNRRKEYDKALATVEKALKIDGKDFFSLETRGKIRLGLRDYQGAIDDLSASIKSMPKLSMAYLDRGVAYFILGKDAEAQADFDSYLQIFPNGKMNLEKRLEEAKAIRAESGKR